MPSRRRDILIALLVFEQALVPRLIAVASLNPREIVYTDPLYKKYAQSVSQGRGYVCDHHFEGVGAVELRSFRPPLFPMLWGLVYGWTEGFYTPIRVAHAILGALTCLLVYFLGRALFSRPVGVAASVIAGWYPPLVWHSINLMTEPLFIFWLTTSVCLLVAARRRDSGWASGLAGAAAGLGILSRSVLVGFVPLAGVWLLWASRGWRRGMVLAAAYGLGVLVAMSPWVLRNHRVHGRWVITTTDGGHGFLIGNNPGALDDPRGVKEPDSWAFAKGLSEWEMNKAFFKRGLANLRDNPWLWPRLAWDKFCRFWRFYPHLEYVSDDADDVHLVKPRYYAILYGLSYGLLFPFIVGGAVIAYVRRACERWDLGLIALLTAYMTGIHLLFIAVMRYRVPLMPLLMVLAGYAIIHGLTVVGSRCEKRLSPE